MPNKFKSVIGLPVPLGLVLVLVLILGIPGMAVADRIDPLESSAYRTEQRRAMLLGGGEERQQQVQQKNNYLSKNNTQSLNGTPSGSNHVTTSKTNPIRKKRWIVGVTYPGITLGVQSSRFAFELRGYSGNDVTLFGPRFSHFVYPFRGGNLYWGLDAFYISDFEGAITEGDGYMAGGFIGLQKYLGSYFSISLDSGPYWIAIEDDLSGVDEDGVEFVINSSLNVHF